MTQKLQFNVEAIDGNFTRTYDTVQEFKDNELGKYVGLSTGSMTSSDGICVYYPADDYTIQQIEIYQAEEFAKNYRHAAHHNTHACIADGSGLGYANLYLMKQHNKEHGNDSKHFVETDAGRFFIETREDDSLFDSISHLKSHFRTINVTEQNMVDAFSKQNLGFGSMKKPGINTYILDANTLLVQDKNKQYDSLDAIKAAKMSNEKAVISTLRTATYDGNEDTPGTTSYYQPAMVSADPQTFRSIMMAHYPEECRENDGYCYDYDEAIWLDNNTKGFQFDKEHPIYHNSVRGFDSEILQDGEKRHGKVVFVTKEFLDTICSADDNGLTVAIDTPNPDKSETIYLELGKSYEITGGGYGELRAFTEIPKGTYKKYEHKNVDHDFPF